MLVFLLLVLIFLLLVFITPAVVVIILPVVVVVATVFVVPVIFVVVPVLVVSCYCSPRSHRLEGSLFIYVLQTYSVSHYTPRGCPSFIRSHNSIW